MVIMGPGRTIIDLSISSLQMITADIFSIEESLKSKSSHVIGKFSIERLWMAFSDLSEKLSSVYYFVCDNWGNIESNPIFCREVLSFVKSFQIFDEALNSLGNLMDKNAGCLESAYTDGFIVYEYFALLNSFKSRFSEVIDRIPQVCDMHSARRTRFRGMAKDLKQYIKGANDEFLDKLIHDHIIVGGKAEWIGPKNEATLFAQKYMLSQKIMNDAFIFYGRNGSCSIVQFSKDKCCNEKESYRIWPILSKYSI